MIEKLADHTANYFVDREIIDKDKAAIYSGKADH